MVLGEELLRGGSLGGLVSGARMGGLWNGGGGSSGVCVCVCVWW